MSKSLKLAFSELIETRKWYEHSLRSPIQAKNDKAKFLKGERLSEEQMRDYLSAAGWICIQEEEWNPPATTINESFRELIKEEKWFEHSSYPPLQANKDKAKFLSDKTVVEGHIREYLLSAGYKMIQIEKWTSSAATMSKAFRKLIKARKWYIHSSRSPSQSQNDKAKFLSGKRVIEDHIREYLLSAGYKIIHEEKWVKL